VRWELTGDPTAKRAWWYARRMVDLIDGKQVLPLRSSAAGVPHPHVPPSGSDGRGVGVRADRNHGAGSNRNTSHRGCTYWRRPSIRQTIVTTMAIITKTAPTPEARSGRLPASGAADRTAATTLMPSAESATAATVRA
jgi:hypothetical protein